MDGFQLTGVLVGYAEKPWPNDQTKFNRRVAINTGSYTDEFGQQHVNTQLVDIQLQDIESVKSQCNSLAGQHVSIPVVPVAKKGGSNGAWLSVFMPKGGQIQKLK